jgi:hypothetical protein
MKAPTPIVGARDNTFNAGELFKEETSTRFQPLAPARVSASPNLTTASLFRLCFNEYFAELDNLIETLELQFELWSEPNLTLRTLCAIT